MCHFEERGQISCKLIKFNFQLEKDELEISLIATMGDLRQASRILDSEMFYCWLCCTNSSG